MRIKILKDTPGSPDGIHVYQYEAGKLYEVSESLGAVLLDAGLAKVDKGRSEPAVEAPADPPKMVDAPATENK